MLLQGKSIAYRTYIIGRNAFKIMRCELGKKCTYGLSHKRLKFL